MPHAILQYSADLEKSEDIVALCRSLPEIMLETGLFPNPKGIKVRAFKADHGFMVVENQSFAHVTIRMMPGRTGDEKHAVASHVLDWLTAQMPQVGTITVEADDLDAASYVKRIL